MKILPFLGLFHKTRPNWARKVREMIMFSVLCSVHCVLGFSQFSMFRGSQDPRPAMPRLLPHPPWGLHFQLPEPPQSLLEPPWSLLGSPGASQRLQEELPRASQNHPGASRNWTGRPQNWSPATSSSTIITKSSQDLFESS